MRLWHQALIPYLPRQQLLGQHRECCALRGKGWGRKHKTVDYVFRHDYSKLFTYHIYIIREMEARGYHVNSKWYMIRHKIGTSKPQIYRGSKIGYDDLIGKCTSSSKLLQLVSLLDSVKITFDTLQSTKLIYPEHNTEYLCECIENLKRKNVVLNGITFEELDLQIVLNGVKND